MRRVLSLLVVLLFVVGLAQAGTLTPDLKAKVEKAAPGEKLKVIVRMDREADISVFPSGQREAMVKHLQAFAAESQRDLLTTLPKYGDKVTKVRPFWIINGIAMEATKDVILAIASRPEVGRVDIDRIYHIEKEMAKGGPRVNSVEWNITQISAPQAWAAGYTGTGVVVGNMDTGVDVSHSTFGGRWRGGNNSWFDAVNGQTSPYDDHGHGTHTMGTICGGSTADTIGVARGSTFVCAKAFDSGGSGSTANILACYQWFAGTSQPNVFGNSWGNSDGSVTDFWQASRNCQVLGIHQAYSNGNSGPGSGSVGAPASHPHLIGVGATDASDVIASFSSRGPSPSFAGGLESTANYLDPNWASSRRKPDLSAPGVNVRSAAPGGGWATMSGTSMASPHVTGTIGLMLQKNPNLTDQQIWDILVTSCDTPSSGRPYPNQNYGWGRLNAYRAVMNTPSASGPNIYLAGFSFAPPPMPGVTVSVVDTVGNNGQGDLTNAQGTLRTSSSYAHLTDSTYSFGTIAAGSRLNNGSSPFQFTVDPGTPRNTGASFTLHIVGDTTGGQYIRDLPFSITLNPHAPDTNGTDFYVMGSGDNGSGTLVANTLYNLGYGGKYYDDQTFTGYPSITPYRSVWVFVPALSGTNTTYTLMQSGGSDETAMVNYLNAGGRMYFENADMGWACDPTGGGLLSTYYPMLNIASYSDYSGNMASEIGNTGHFAEGMNFAYDQNDTGANTGNDIDTYTPGSGAFALFTSSTGGENQAIAYDSGTYRTLLSSFLFHGLIDASPPSTQAIYADSIMHWFGIFTGVEEASGGKVLPRTYQLGAARPNPSSQGAAIYYALPLDSKVSLKVYNLTGQLVSTLVDGKLPAGYHEARFDGRGLPAGVYFYRLEAGSFWATKKVVLLR